MIGIGQGTSLTLTACLVHGYGAYFYIGDEGLPTGANWCLELVTCLETLTGPD